jgi:hypothetical protein
MLASIISLAMKQDHTDSLDNSRLQCFESENVEVIDTYPNLEPIVGHRARGNWPVLTFQIPFCLQEEVSQVHHSGPCMLMAYMLTIVLRAAKPSYRNALSIWERCRHNSKSPCHLPIMPSTEISRSSRACNVLLHRPRRGQQSCYCSIAYLYTSCSMIMAISKLVALVP